MNESHGNGKRVRRIANFIRTRSTRFGGSFENLKQFCHTQRPMHIRITSTMSTSGSATFCYHSTTSAAKTASIKLQC